MYVTFADDFRVLVIGAGGLGVWALKMAEYVMRDSQLTKDRVHITVADTSVELHNSFQNLQTKKPIRYPLKIQTK